GRRSYDVEYRIVRLDGQIKWVHVRDAIDYDATGAPVRMFGTVQDVTERRSVEEALRANQQLLHLVLSTLPVAVIVTDRNGNILLSNDMSKQIWGKVIEGGGERWALSKGSWHESGKTIRPNEWASVRALSEGRSSLNELINIETFDGKHRTIQNSAVPI